MGRGQSGIQTQNTSTPKGRGITTADIQGHARPGHFPCRGKGFLKRRGKTRKPLLCRCAQKAFLAAHPEVIIDARGLVFWPAGKEPAPPARACSSCGVTGEELMAIDGEDYCDDCAEGVVADPEVIPPGGRDVSGNGEDLVITPG